MRYYPATLLLFSITLSLNGPFSPWILAFFAIFQRNIILLIASFISLSLTTAHTIWLPSCGVVFCDLCHCHWTVPKSDILTFLLREARLKVSTPSRAGFYEVIFRESKGVNTQSKSASPLLIYLPELSEKMPVKLQSEYWATAQVTDAIIYGRSEPTNILSSFFGRFGASHLLCLSAWHVGFIRRFTLHKPLRILILLALLLTLNAPFPLLRAAIATLMPHGEDYHSQIEYWSLSWLIALLLSPFSWTTWSFWLSFYYGALFLYTKPNLLYLRLSNLVWISLWDIDWDPIALILGAFLEPIFIIVLILGWISYPISFMIPAAVNALWAGIFQLYLDYSFLGLAMPSPALPSSTLLLLFFVMQARKELIVFHLSKNFFTKTPVNQLY